MSLFRSSIPQVSAVQAPALQAPDPQIEEEEARDEATRERSRRRALFSSIRTSPLGAIGQPTTARSRLLGV